MYIIGLCNGARVGLGSGSSGFGDLGSALICFDLDEHNTCSYCPLAAGLYYERRTFKLLCSSLSESGSD